MTDRPTYDVAVVGGGPAGTTTALYTTRLGHRTAVFEREGGRHAAVSHVHNVYGVSEDVSGHDLALHAAEQFREYGGDYYLEEVEDVREADGEFVLESKRSTVRARRVVLATGFTDVPPSVPDLLEFTGRGLHYCLHCDAYTLGDARVFVLGHDEHAAHVAMVMLNYTDEVDLLLDDETPGWDEATERQLASHPVDRVETAVVGAYPEDPDAPNPWLGGLTFSDGTDREYRGGFAMYGTEYNTRLAEALGCDLADDGAVAVDDDYETSVDGVYAVGDLTHGDNQTAVSLGDGAAAGIAIDKDLRRFPLDPDELDDHGLDDGDVPAAPPDLRSTMRLVREMEDHAGLREPSPGR